MNKATGKELEVLQNYKSRLKPEQAMLSEILVLIESFLVRYFNKNSPYHQKRQHLAQRAAYLSFTALESSQNNKDTEEKVKSDIEVFLDNLSYEIEQLGFHTDDKAVTDNSITITNSQSQNQEQEQSAQVYVVVETLKDTLTVKQYQELLDVIKNEGHTKHGSALVLEKVKGFGVNVLASIVASVITNPSLMTGLINS